MSSNTIPFTYLVGWSQHHVFYYGVRYARNQGPSSLWTTYFTSSKDVAKTRRDLGEPDIVEVRRTFTSRDTARKWEERVLKRLHAATSSKWLNRREAPAFPVFEGAANPMFGKCHSIETKKKIGDKAKGRKMSEEHRQKCRERNAGHKNPFFGRSHSIATVQKIKEARLRQRGDKATSAKRFLFIDPSGKEYTVVGGFDTFCKANQLSRTKMHLAINKGAIAPFIGNNMTTQLTRNCVGWSVSSL